MAIERKKGRGAQSNPANRFQTRSIESFDDGWGAPHPMAPKTTPIADTNRSIVTTNQSPDIPFNLSINPYRGCEHGCIYCYARPTHEYLGYSPGLDFETKILLKNEAAPLLDDYLRRPGYQCQPIALGAVTDGYQPLERKHQLTRSVLLKALEFRQPIFIITKSNLVLRDLDILEKMAERQLIHVSLSITTLRRDIASTLEPRAPTPQKRIQALASLSASGVSCGVMVSPLIPGLTDHELEPILEQSSQAGARHATYLLLRLPGAVADLFKQWLKLSFPDRYRKVLSQIRAVRGGEINETAFFDRFKGKGIEAQLLEDRFNLACLRFHLKRQEPNLNCSDFAPPPRAGDQLSLF